MRHLSLAFALLALAAALAGCGSCGRPLADGLPDTESCSGCHGTDENAAPPEALVKSKTTMDVEVGQHQLHVVGGFARRPLQCEECHVVPVNVEDEGHVDKATPERPSDPADVTFGPLARRGVTPVWSRGAASCANTYCHGATLRGGARTTPVWTFDQQPEFLTTLSVQTCSGCHGAPPPPPHRPRADCESCHATTCSEGLVVVPGGTHLDGKVDVAATCDACHGNAINAAPPTGVDGATATSARGVGAHQQHLTDSAIRKAVACADCHLVPATTDAVGHLDSPLPAELTFSPLSTADGGLVPSFDGTSCANTYCHGATLSGGATTTPVWTLVDGSQARCGSCHGAPPPPPHPASTVCSACHPLTALGDGGIDVDGGHHIDGVLDVVALTCTSCHGGPANAAPPVDTAGRSATSERGVGAHQQHLAASTWRRAILCDACHAVPATVDAVGHVDTALPAELTWGSLALARGATPTWDGATCSGAYCHGARTRGGTNKAPAWTQVDAGQAACGTCHGVPPPNHLGNACHYCHPTMSPTGDIADPARHVDGVVDVSDGGVCGGCHPVPPQTGAHAAHYGDQSGTPLATYGDTRQVRDYFDGGQPWYMFGCGTCHPLDVGRHLDGVVEIELSDADAGVGTLKARSGPAAFYSPDAGTCGNVYCHSSGQQSPVYVTSPGWRSGARLGCDGCHGNPPAYPSGGAGTPTANVHLVMADDGWEFGHFGGLPGPWHTSYHGVSTRGAGAITCQTCHFDSVNPQDTGPSGFYWLNTTGTYQLDGGLLGFSCGACHTPDAGVSPVGAGRAQPLAHVNGSREVVFDRRTTLPAGYTGGVSPAPTTPYWVRTSSGQVRNKTLADAGYDVATKTCTNVSCHLVQTSVQWGVTPVGYATCAPCHP